MFQVIGLKVICYNINLINHSFNLNTIFFLIFFTFSKLNLKGAFNFGSFDNLFNS